MKKISICILDYGSGNVKSVFNLATTLNPNVTISNQTRDIENATHLILPGVGAYAAAMRKIHQLIPMTHLEKAVFTDKKPFLGICVGMQVLANKGYEFEITTGLGWIPGEVKKLDSGFLPLPHIGWNNIEVIQTSPLTKQFKTLDFYFVHSFVFQPKNKKNLIAQTNYGNNFAAIINMDNIYGVQFHPEKSQKAGQMLLYNFLNL
ncbi:MAG: Imidazole glycerol phosphate synthase subunit HisH [Candidatus Gottesmanbacteria bacterium GW2011_GWA1_34_13]|uniref:Imidazole glycerol phosphate synthase subunit HisH n=1 Tax=Candidatus Gottesmanbacteria bacterium GW2011_GWA1_34_13 TaxID=1618434 RepID=A0A0G0ASV9_9BACT|nr:MAG: Imidazole glycerol phosphate synthase subunit HisH [Candidatus Gottesmanbacteria bacterium GW2011_GWA1_34_13]